MPLYGKMLPLGGIISKANRGIRQLDRGFYGAGFPHPGVEATLEQANKLLMHYGFLDSSLHRAADLPGTSGGGPGPLIPTLSSLSQTLWRLGHHIVAQKDSGKGQLLWVYYICE
jgi:hypothetical protein